MHPQKVLCACMHALKIYPGIPINQEHNFYTYSKTVVRNKVKKTVKQIYLLLYCNSRENAEMSAH